MNPPLVSLGLDTTDSNKSNLDVYRESFESPFIHATEVYYTTESEKFISENSIPDYMKKVKGLKVEKGIVSPVIRELPL